MHAFVVTITITIALGFSIFLLQLSHALPIPPTARDGLNPRRALLSLLFLLP